MTQAKKYDQMLRSLESDFTKPAFNFQRGIERESLRVDATGNLANTPHPQFLGSKLTHPTITTDFSEAQLELITPVSNSIDATLKTLNDTHRFVYSGLGEEILWATSMPCVLQGDQNIPLAQYGSSNLASLKTTYRNGLGNRYGRSMQTICAVHYNFSFPDTLWKELAKRESCDDSSSFRSRRYFDVMRNFRRFSWLPIYLFGSSPAVCKSFVKGRQHALDAFDEGSLYKSGATSLRNGNLGYQSDAQSELLNICYNSLENYVSHLARAVTSPFKAYQDIGIQSGEEFLQVNEHVLQSEAEFYTTIRAKCVPPKGENFLTTLLNDGVEYIEVRLLDVNPFDPLGINAEAIRFIDTLLLHCLLMPSPSHDESLCHSVKTNVASIVTNGREADTRLDDQGKSRLASDWADEILADLAKLAQHIDLNQADSTASPTQQSTQHEDSIRSQQAKVQNADLTPSGQVIAEMRDQNIPFFRFAMNKALEHKTHFLDQPLSKDELDYFNQLSESSIADQLRIEDETQLPFTEYLQKVQQEYIDLVKTLA